MARQVVFIANDFGFGPSSRAHAIARSFQQAFPDIKATYLTSGKNDYLFADSDVALTTCDDTRSSAVLKQTFKQFDNALIVSELILMCDELITDTTKLEPGLRDAIDKFTKMMLVTHKTFGKKNMIGGYVKYVLAEGSQFEKTRLVRNLGIRLALHERKLVKI